MPKSRPLFPFSETWPLAEIGNQGLKSVTTRDIYSRFVTSNSNIDISLHPTIPVRNSEIPPAAIERQLHSEKIRSLCGLGLHEITGYNYEERSAILVQAFKLDSIVAADAELINRHLSIASTLYS